MGIRPGAQTSRPGDAGQVGSARLQNLTGSLSLVRALAINLGRERPRPPKPETRAAAAGKNAYPPAAWSLDRLAGNAIAVRQPAQSGAGLISAEM